MTPVGVRRSVTACVVSTALAWFASADPPIILPVDMTQSSLTVELCLATGICDMDVSPVAGFFQIQLGDNGAPAHMVLHDFQLIFTEPINHMFISQIPFASFTTDSTNVSLRSAQTGALGPVAVISGDFTFTSLDAQLGGLTEYEAGGGVCLELQGANPPLPCVGTIDLSTIPSAAAPLSGQVFSAPTPGGHTLVFSAVISGLYVFDLFASHPELSLPMRLTGVVHGSAFVPTQCAGDADGNDFVNVNDLSYIIFRLGDSGTPGFVDGDVDKNGAVNVNDISFVIFRLGTVCS